MKEIKLFSDSSRSKNLSLKSDYLIPIDQWPRSLESMTDEVCAECGADIEDCYHDAIVWEGTTWCCCSECLERVFAYRHEHGGE